MVKPLVLDVLHHIRTYRLTTARAVSKLFELGGEAIGVDLLETLHEAGLLGRGELTPSEDYYYLEPKAGDEIELRDAMCGPSNSTGKATRYATLYFCCLEGVYRPLIPQEVFPERFRDLYLDGPHINYYTEGSKFGYIRVETYASTGGDAGRVMDRSWRDVYKRTSGRRGPGLPAFKKLVEEGRFVITLLVAFEQKAQRVRRELHRWRERYQQFEKTEKARGQDPPVPVEKNTYLEYERYKREGKRPPPPPPIEVHVVPGLFELIYPKPRPVN